MKARSRYQRANAGTQVERRQDDGARAVLPRAFELVAQPIVVGARETLFGDRGPAEVPAQTRELSTVVAVHTDGGVHVDAVRDGNGLVGAGQARVDQPQSRRARARSEQVCARGGRGVTGSERRILLARGVGEHADQRELRVELSAVLLQHPDQARGRAAGHVRDVLGTGLGELVKGEHSVGCAHVHAVKR
jgi:hypothetical protein